MVRANVGSHVPYCIASPQTNPLRNGTVLFLRLCKLLLGTEGFVGLRYINVSLLFLVSSFLFYGWLTGIVDAIKIRVWVNRSVVQYTSTIAVYLGLWGGFSLRMVN